MMNSSVSSKTWTLMWSLWDRVVFIYSAILWMLTRAIQLKGEEMSLMSEAIKFKIRLNHIKCFLFSQNIYGGDHRCFHRLVQLSFILLPFGCNIFAFLAKVITNKSFHTVAMHCTFLPIYLQTQLNRRSASRHSHQFGVMSDSDHRQQRGRAHPVGTETQRHSII